MLQVEVPVLVVGAGPVGTMAGILLDGQGVESLVVERRDGPHRAPQAHVVNPRSLEICRAVGVDMDEIRARATPRADSGQVVWVTTLAGEEIGRARFEGQVEAMLAATPTPIENISQHLFEPILHDRLAKAGRAELRFGHQWESSEQDAGGVTSRVRDLASDEVVQVRSRWVLAADGAGSRVRGSVGIAMDGPARIASFVMIHVEANFRSIVRERPAILYWVMNSDCRGVFVAHEIDRTWVYMHPFEPDSESEEDYTEAVCTEVVQRALGTADADFAVRGWGMWTMTAQVAERYRDRRIFLVGDAAHRFPPTGGLGMNSGIQDAHNLVWKLGAVEARWGAEGLLDSYEQERRGVARSNCDQSLRNALKMIEVPTALGISEDREASRDAMAAVLADPAGRAQVADAIRGQDEHFDLLGQHLGFTYEAGAVISDGTEEPVPENPSRDYLPSTRPGARLPHAWIERAGQRVSTLDLAAAERFTLLTGADGGVWAEAAARVEGVPLACLVPGRDFTDPDGGWLALSGLAPGGALLVRPDGHVGWRVQETPADPAAALRGALERLAGRRP